MKFLLLVALIFSNLSVFCQKVINFETKTEGQIFLIAEIAIPKINPGYTLWLPVDGSIKGLIVFTHTRRDTVNSDSLINYALQNHLAVLYATTDNRLEFFFDKNKMHEIEGYINDVIKKHNIPKENLLFCGMSLEGTHALRLTMFANTSDS